MSTVSVTAGEIMDSVAALLNDTQKQVYTYANQLPYLKMAMKELRELLELSNIPVTNETSAVLTVPAGTTVVGFVTTPALPSDLVEIQRLWGRQSSSDSFYPLTKIEFLPHYLEDIDVNYLSVWAWLDNKIHLLASIQENQLKLDYIAQLFNLSTLDQNTAIGVINSDSFLQYKTAGLCAEYVGENSTRAQGLYANAIEALDRIIGIGNKSKQAIFTRHRPFRSSYKSRRW